MQGQAFVIGFRGNAGQVDHPEIIRSQRKGRDRSRLRTQRQAFGLQAVRGHAERHETRHPLFIGRNGPGSAGQIGQKRLASVELEKAREEITGILEGRSKTVRVAVSPSSEAVLLPRVVERSLPVVPTPLRM